MTASRWLLVLLLVQGVALADVYRWVDEDGRVHFTDRPPPGEGEQLEIAPAPGPQRPSGRAADAVPDRDRLLRMFEKRREERKAAKAEADKERARLRRDCDRLAGALRRYQSGGPVYDPLPDGSRRYYTAAEKDREMAQMRQALQRHCGGVPADLQPKTGR
jgi:hypothetical protein